LHDPIALQERLDAIAKLNNDVASAKILFPQGDGFKVIASTDRREVDQVNNDLENVVAWHQGQPIARLTTKLVNEEDRGINGGSRYWAIIMPLVDSQGDKQAVLSLKVSLNVMDAITRQIVWQSYIILGIIIFIIILLLANNTKILEYVNLYRKLKEVDRLKDDFISIASHELRAPVTGIHGYASMMRGGTYGDVPVNFQEPLQAVEQAASRLSNLVDDLLNVSRMEQGRLQFNLQPTMVYPLIKESIGELVANANEKKLDLVFKPHAEDLPLINIDADRFDQVLDNILSNAIKYTNAGTVEVTTEEKNGFLIIRVKDMGIGMSSAERVRLFEKFYRIKNENTKHIVGTGLGLWLTKSIIETMKGQIQIKSIKNVGTQVTVSFPIIRNKN
jgi:signal transduction histidine kinase